ncbi:MAG TPA: di-heme oxidoredictase family protein [Blastocatellia bacterium]|jgi:CxxC motif-containing protein (DUF1111 family)
MRILKISALLLFAAALVMPFAFTSSVEGQAATEAPTGMDTLTNGFVTQATHDDDRATFEERDDVTRGLGPIYNAQSCAECHQNPVTGGISQITELRAGHNDAFGNFVAATVTINDGGGLGGGVTITNRSLINDRATCPGVVTDLTTHAVIYNHPNEQGQERVPGAENIRTFRTSNNTLGDGFVECIDSNVLLAISNGQPSNMRGQFIQVPVLEANNAVRGGRFGWKNQHASLLSFSSDAYLNEQGITNRFNTRETIPNTGVGTTGVLCDEVSDNQPCASNPNVNCAEDPEEDINAFARFMRASKAPSRDARLAATSDAQTGSALFDQIGCNICHVRNITTLPAGSIINQGAFTVPAALGNKIIHPFSDFLLHNVGTGDGIAQSPAPANKMRTAPLWGMRTRDRLMHDGEELTRNDAILRHAGEAAGVINSYINLSTTQKNQLITFLNSL